VKGKSEQKGGEQGMDYPDKQIGIIPPVDQSANFAQQCDCPCANCTDPDDTGGTGPGTDTK
jgi:hypothetical protein